MLQSTAWLITLIFMSFIAIVFAFVTLRSTQKADYEPIMKKWYKIRTVYGMALLIFLLGTALYTLRDLPYDRPVYGEGIEPTIVDVEAIQFGWKMSQSEFKAGEPIEFKVTSTDVNHGFGIYDENMNVLAQTQAMPGYTNNVYYTFEKPGTYQILCLEYCGLAHHLMVGQIKVTE